MLEIKKSINVSGTSTVVIDGVNTVVATMNANLTDESGPVNKNSYIQDPALYTANKEAVKKDISDFGDAVDALAGI